MRKSGRWMQLLDDRILEFLAEEDWGSPKVIAQELRYDVPAWTVEERLRGLTQVEFVAPIADGAEGYEITTWGARYLEGDLDARHHTPQLRWRARHGHSSVARRV